MDCSKKRASEVGHLPVDPLVEILSRVPLKSICRFKCVSKAWLDLITDPLHRKKLPQAMQGLFCHTSKKSEAGQSYSFSFVDMAARYVPLDIDPSFSFLSEQPGIRFLHFRDSCNGLVLFEHRERRGSARLGYIVCNPTTKEWKVVPACGSLTSLNYTYLAFDPAVSSHFNLVQFQVEDNEEFLSVHAYSSETGTWSGNQIDEPGEERQFQGWRQVRFNLGDPNPRCPFVNGFLHLVVLDQDQIRKIVALDVQGKARRMIPVLYMDDGRCWMCYFGESQGKLHYMTQELLDARERKSKFSIWVLQDYGAQEWVLKGTVNTNEVFGENSGRGGTEGFELVEDVEVVDTHQHHNVIFFTHSLDCRFVDIHPDHSVGLFTHFLEHKLVAYDMDREEVSTIATFDDGECLVGTARYVPYF
ncbi:unnamed protein product [Urochloa humidicola]